MSDKTTEVGKNKQHRLADKYHTCTCPEKGIFWLWNTSRIVDVDFENAEREEPNGRTLWMVTKCGGCKGSVLHGRTFTDYRTTGEELLQNAIDCVSEWIVSNCRATGTVNANTKNGKFEAALRKLWRQYKRASATNRGVERAEAASVGASVITGKGMKLIRHVESGWSVVVHVDDDHHLNVYIENSDGSDIHDIESGQGDGTQGEQLACRFTTDNIEKEYQVAEGGAETAAGAQESGDVVVPGLGGAIEEE